MSVLDSQYKGKFKPMEVLSGPYDPDGQPDVSSGNAMEFGIFGWNVNCGSTGSKAVLVNPDRHQRFWQWEIASKLLPEFERIGFEYEVPFARWIGHGGVTGFNDASLDFASGPAGLVSLTKKMSLFSTAHTSYGFHPLHLAKIGACIDAMSGGRWGLNIVAGYSQKEFAAFGIEPLEKNHAYDLTDEFITLMKHFWHETERIEFEGKYFQTYGGYVAPRPARNPRPVLMSAGQSDRGVDFACKHADVIFCIHPDIEGYREFVEKVHAKAAQYGRKVRVATHCYMMMDTTDERARSTMDWIEEEVDNEAGINHLDSLTTQSTAGTFGWGEEAPHRDDQYGGVERDAFMRASIGIGAYRLIGGFESVAEQLRQLHEVGVESALLSTFDPLRMQHQMEDDLMPILRKMGLRK